MKIDVKTALNMALVVTAAPVMAETYPHPQDEIYQNDLTVTAETKEQFGFHTMENGLFSVSDQFFGDSRTWIKLRTAYMNKDYRSERVDSKYPSRDPSKRKQYNDWAQSGMGLELNFESGWINNWIGFDASYYGATAFDGDGNYKEAVPGSGLLHKNNSGEPTGYGKLGQAYLKMRFGDENLSGQFRIGRQKIWKGMLSTSTSRLTPMSWEAALAEVNWHGVELYGVYATGISYRSDSHFESFYGDYSGKTKVDYIYSYGMRYQPERGLGFEAAYGEGQNYAKSMMGRVNYTLDIAGGYLVFLDAQHYQVQSLDNQASSNWYSTTHSDWNYKNRAYDLDAKPTLNNLNLMVSKDDWSVWLSHMWVNAPLTDNYYNYDSKQGNLRGNGEFKYNLASNDYAGNQSWIGVPNYVSNFMYDGERSWQVGGQYYWDRVGIPGLITRALYTTGSNAKRLGRVGSSSRLYTFEGKEWERTFEVKYRFQSRPLKGLQARLVQTTYRSNFNSDAEDVRLYLDYYLTLF